MTVASAIFAPGGDGRKHAHVSRFTARMTVSELIGGV